MAKYQQGQRLIEKVSSFVYTSTADVQRYLADCLDWNDLSLGEDSQVLLKAASAELGLDPKQRETAIKVARTIANLDHEADIHSRHICEAINYRMLRG